MNKINEMYISLISVKSRCDSAIKRFIKEEKLYPDDLFGNSDSRESFGNLDVIDYFCGLYEGPAGVYAQYESRYASRSIPLAPAQVESLNNELEKIISTLGIPSA
jgi:hypothetical protein